MPRYVDVEPIISNTIAMKSICTAIDIDGIVKRLEEAPTADVKPVVRGKWLETCYENNNGEIFMCSICGHAVNKTRSNGFEFANFCEECGARMDGGNND